MRLYLETWGLQFSRKLQAYDIIIEGLNSPLERGKVLHHGLVYERLHTTSTTTTTTICTDYHYYYNSPVKVPAIIRL